MHLDASRQDDLENQPFRQSRGRPARAPSRPESLVDHWAGWRKWKGIYRPNVARDLFSEERL